MKDKILITGGAGFIGSNLSAHFMKAGYAVTILDDLSRQGSKANLEWLGTLGKFDLVVGDIRNPSVAVKAVKGQTAVFHLAGQVAVTTSVTDPRTDYEINALGTFNMLEAARLSPLKP